MIERTYHPEWYDKLPKKLEKGYFVYCYETKYLKMVLDERCKGSMIDNTFLLQVNIPQAHNIGCWDKNKRISRAILQFENDVLVEIADMSHELFHLTAEQLKFIKEHYGLIEKTSEDE